MKKIYLLVLPLIIVVLVAMGGLIWWKSALGAPSANEETKTFLITKGSSSDTIGKNLAKAGLIKNAFAYKLYVQKEGVTTKIPPGEFVLAQNLTLPELIDTLLEGPTELWVTVPEGLRREEVPDKFIETLSMSSDQAQTFRTEFLNTSKGMEGYLFPDTYLVPPDISASKVVSLMRNTFDTKFTDPYESSIASSQFSLDDIVVLASLLERETLTKEERPIVAGILINRLENGWPLQIDATVQYALGKSGNWWPKPLTRENIEVDSPYNTYKYGGIPPAPIANPGLTSLVAIVEPEQTDYYFYLHAPDGQIYYGETLQDHNDNIRQYLNK